MLFLVIATWMIRFPFKKVQAPTLSHSTLDPGDLLFSPVGKRESKYVGHVGIVSVDQHIIHSTPSGLIKDSPPVYYRKFNLIRVYQPIDHQTGEHAARYAESLYQKHPNALYSVNTRLDRNPEIQYCTKIVWQSYHYGADVNLGKLPVGSRAVHPVFLRKKGQLTKKN